MERVLKHNKHQTTVTMSIHAALSPEALARLERQKKQSTVTSVIISILTVLLVGVVLALAFLPVIKKDEPHIKYVSGRVDKDPPLDKPTMNRAVQMKPSSPMSMANPVVANVRSKIALPRSESEVDATGLISGDGFGTGLEGLGGENGGPPYGNIPVSNPQRCSKEERLARLEKYGASPEVEDAVVRALRWMKENQSSDGSWGQSHKVGMTGLALLAYIGHCETPDSEEFGESCLSAIIYLLNVGTKNNGKLASDTADKHWPYEHAIATYALAEAFSFGGKNGFGIPRHKEVLEKAGQWIIENQHTSGGWDYAYDVSGKRGGDLSIVAWHIQALKACDVTGLKFTNMKSTVRKALDYVSGRQAESGGFGYVGTQPVGGAGHHSLTGAGMLSFQMWSKGSRSEVRKGARYILAKAELEYNGPESDLYAHYYHSQAMMQRGGEQWRKYNQRFHDQILHNQNADGSWKKPGGNGAPKAVGALFAKDTPEGVHYRTCLCALMLEVYYRYLPASR